MLAVNHRNHSWDDRGATVVGNHIERLRKVGTTGDLENSRAGGAENVESGTRLARVVRTDSDGSTCRLKTKLGDSSAIQVKSLEPNILFGRIYKDRK